MLKDGKDDKTETEEVRRERKLEFLNTLREEAKTKASQIQATLREVEKPVDQTEKNVKELQQKKLILAWSESEERKEGYKKMASLEKDAKCRDSFTKTRDFLLLELLLFGGGNRMDAYRK